jgi:hypothetical protein
MRSERPDAGFTAGQLPIQDRPGACTTTSRWLTVQRAVALATVGQCTAARAVCTLVAMTALWPDDGDAWRSKPAGRAVPADSRIDDGTSFTDAERAALGLVDGAVGS